MDIRRDAWLADVMGHDVYRVDAGRAGALPSGPEELAEAVGRHAQRQTRAMYYAKVDTREVEVVRRLSRVGMYVVDVNMTFDLAVDRAIERMIPEDVAVSDIRPAQHDAVLDLAHASFRFSRFHLDPQVPAETANRVKREWIHSYIRGERGEALLVASLGGQPAGFLAVLASESNGARLRVIDLVAVGPSVQGRGVGRAICQAFINRYRDRCDALRVGTQAANVPSIGLYQQLGFMLLKSEYVLHLHVAR